MAGVIPHFDCCSPPREPQFRGMAMTKLQKPSLPYLRLSFAIVPWTEPRWALAFIHQYTRCRATVRFFSTVLYSAVQRRTASCRIILCYEINQQPAPLALGNVKRPEYHPSTGPTLACHSLMTCGITASLRQLIVISKLAIAYLN
jgi:hypothetical protein